MTRRDFDRMVDEESWPPLPRDREGAQLSFYQGSVLFLSKDGETWALRDGRWEKMERQVRR
jgi:hypothetical protein